MDFDSIKKDRPKLTDYNYLKKVVEAQKPPWRPPKQPISAQGLWYVAR